MISFITESKTKIFFSFTDLKISISIRLNWTFELLFLAVGKLHIVIIVWVLMNLLSSIGVFYAIYTWAKTRKYASVYLSRNKRFVNEKENLLFRIL